MGRTTSSGVAKAGLVTGIIGTAGFANELLGGNGLLGRNTTAQTELVSKLQAELAQERSKNYSDQSGLEIYRYFEGQFKERDVVTTGVLIEAARNDERNKCLSDKVTTLQDKVAMLEVESCNNKANLIKLHGDIDTLATATTAGLDKLMCYVNANFVKGELKMPAASICPSVQLVNDKDIQQVQIVS